MQRARSPFRIHGKAPLLLALLVALLSAPALVGFQRDSDQTTRKMENREQAPRPPLQLLRTNPPEFVQELDQHLKDAVGFRHLANAAYRKLRYFIFHDPPLLNLTIGSDGHVFLNGPRPDAYNGYLNALCLEQGQPTPELLRTLDSTLSAATHYFSSRGAKVTFAIVPTALPLYADKLPLSVPSALRKACMSYPRSDNALARLMRMGQQSANYAVFYPLDLFEAHKNERGFYPKERYHCAGKSIYLFIRHLLKASGATDQLLLADPNALGMVKHDIAGFFGFGLPVEAYVYPYADRPTREESAPWMDAVNREKQCVYHSVTDNAVTEKTALMIGNSFGTEARPHLARGFRHLYFLNTNNIIKGKQKEAFQAVATHIQPDYVYFLFDDYNVTNLPDWLAGFVELDQQEAPQRHSAKQSGAEQRNK